MPSELTAGSEKLAALKLYQRLEGAVEPTDAGVAPAGRNSGPFCWQRNGRPPVGVPVQ